MRKLSFLDSIIERLFLKIRPKLVSLEKFNEIRFKCIDNCADCCKNYPVAVTDKGLLEHLEKEMLLYSDPHRKDIKLIKKDDGGYCKCLNNYKCLIYKIRPIACQAYPICLDPLDNRAYLDIKCRGLGKGDLLSAEILHKTIESRKEYWNFLNLSENEKILVHENFVKNITRKPKTFK